MFDQAASKYAIILVCVMLLRHLTPRSKGYFMRISTVVSVLKGGKYSSRYFHQKQLNEKYQISRRRLIQNFTFSCCNTIRFVFFVVFFLFNRG